MSDVLVLGGAGELGSNFAKLCIDRGEHVKIVDIVRENEAWRLKWLDIYDKVDYVWKSTFDVTTDDVGGVWLVLDASAQPDRPLGTSSPVYTLVENLFGPTRLLETVDVEYPPIIVYPSSCNVFLGVPKKDQPLREDTKPMPTNFYGWSKLAAEELYLMYHRCYNLPVYVIRTGSCYGLGMRTDQMIAKCILHMLRGKDFLVKSPLASRTYTFSGDVMVFYEKFLDKLGNLSPGMIIHNGGNKENKPYTTLEVAQLIKTLLLDKSNAKLVEAEYELGEMIEEPVMQWESFEYAEKILGWRPEHTLKAGLSKTISWFEKRLEDYVI